MIIHSGNKIITGNSLSQYYFRLIFIFGRKDDDRGKTDLIQINE